MGIYNLPKEEQDRYNSEVDYKTYYEKSIKQKIKRDNKLLHPLEGETYKSYLQRLQILLTQLDEQSHQEHMYGPKGPWWVHKRAQNCFICDYSTMFNQILDVMIDLDCIPKISRLTFVTMKEGSQRLDIKRK